MKQNESWADRIVRMIVGAVFLGLAVYGVAAGFWMYLAYFVGFILILTGAVGFCPLYKALNFSTKKE
jgi:uncharacterized protein (DUF2062 family)